MRKILLWIAVLTPIISFSQEKNNPTYKISGKIIDASSKDPIEFATIVFKSLDSNTIKFGTITNAKGFFSIEVEKGKYDTSVEYFSYKSKKLNVTDITHDVNIGTITIEKDTEALNEIQITAKSKTVNLKPQKQVFYVKNDISAQSSMSTDVLNNIPSVNVDTEGNVSLNGLDAMVMINGKESSMTKAEALKSLPGNAIEKVEIIANPGAQYKASYKSILNIILKKGVNEGLNASITGSIGYKDIYGGALQLNYKTDKINFYTNTSYGYKNNFQDTKSDNEYFENGETTSYLKEINKYNSKQNSLISSVGMDFYISDKTTLSANINYTNLDYNRKTKTNSDIYDSSYNLTSTNYRNHKGDFDDEIIETTLSLEHNFNKEGQKLKTSIQYSHDEETYDNIIVNTNNNYTDEAFIEKNTLKNTNFKTTFINPINDKVTYTVGYEGEFGKTPFTYAGTSNLSDIDYNDNIHAGFAELEFQGDKMYYALGLRAEFTDINIDYLDYNSKITKNYDDLFPSFYAEYTINDTQSLSFSYDRGIARPGYYDLQPYEQKYSETTSFKGNPELDPTYFDSFNLYYSLSTNKFNFSTSLLHQIYTDWMDDVTYETGEQINGVNKILTTKENIGKNNYSNLSITGNYFPNKIVSFIGNISLSNFKIKGNFETVNSVGETIVREFNKSNLLGTLSLLTQVKIPNVFNFQTNLKHNLKSDGDYFKRFSRTYVTATISKDLFNNKATLSLYTNDLFHSYKTKRERFSDYYFSKSLTKDTYQNIILSFTYRFNQSKKNGKIEFDKKEDKINPKL